MDVTATIKELRKIRKAHDQLRTAEQNYNEMLILRNEALSRSVRPEVKIINVLDKQKQLDVAQKSVDSRLKSYVRVISNFKSKLAIEEDN